MPRPEPTPAAPLDQEAKQEAQASWHLLMCPHCGTIHPGRCPRIKHSILERHYPGGVWEREEFVYFDHDEWEVPAGARTMADVFGTAKLAPAPPVPPPPEPKGPKR
jgi:hypothetical protein